MRKQTPLIPGIPVLEAGDNMGTAYGYVRVSTGTQVKGESMEDQERRVTEYYHNRLAPRGVKWGGVFRDPGQSAWRKPLADRPGGREMLMKIRNGDHLIIDAVDRICRSTIDVVKVGERFRSQGVYMHSIDCDIDPTTQAGQMVLAIMGVIAQGESDTKSRRKKASDAEKILSGRYMFHRKYEQNNRCCGVKVFHRKKKNGTTVEYSLHWQEYAIARWCAYSRGHITGHHMISELKAAKEIEKEICRLTGKKYRWSQFTTPHVSSDGVKVRARQWKTHIMPLLETCPFEIQTPLEADQNKEVLYWKAELDIAGNLIQWKQVYTDVGESLIQFPYEKYSLSIKEAIEKFGQRQDHGLDHCYDY